MMMQRYDFISLIVRLGELFSSILMRRNDRMIMKQGKDVLLK